MGSYPSQAQATGSTGGKRQSVGRKIDVGDVISRATGILTRRPSIMLPQILVVIPVFLSYLALNTSGYRAFSLVATIVSAIVSMIVAGAYPFIVKEALEGRQFTIKEAMERAYHKFWTLLGAVILVGIIVGLGTVALVVPGIIFGTWYFYTVPAIMLEDKDALEGMSASKAFGRDKKWSTFLIFLVYFVVLVVIYLTNFIPLAGPYVYTLLAIPLDTWGAAIASYTYITYGPSGGLPPPAAPGPGIPTQSSSVQMPGRQANCPRCGTKLAGDEAFCKSCGTKL